MDWFEKRMKELNYKGFRNCVHKIEKLRTCEWGKNGGDGHLHLFCPRWERKNELQ